MSNFPVPKFYFSVTIDGDKYSFQEVSGLTQEFDNMEYRAGGSRDLGKYQRAGLLKSGKLVLKKGVFTGESDLNDFLSELHGDNSDFRSENTGVPIIVRLLDESNTPVVTWNVRDAVPTKISHGDLKSTDNNIAVESAEFVFTSITSSY